MPVGGRRVVVEDPADVLDRYQIGQFPFLRRLDLPQSFTQLRRDEGQPQRLEQIGFGLGRQTFLGGVWLLRGFRARSVFLIRREQPPLAHAESPGQRALAHLDVVVLRAGQVVQREHELLGRHEPQVGLQAGFEPYAGLEVTAGGDFLDVRLADKPVDDRRRFGGCDQKVQIAHGLHAPPQTAAGFDLLHTGKTSQSLENGCPGFLRLHPKVALAVGFAVADAGQDFLLRLLPKAIERSHLARLTSGPQARNRVHAELFLQGPHLLRAQAGD